MEEKKITSKEVKMQPIVTSQKNANNIANGSLVEELQKWSKEKLIEQVIQMDRHLYNQDNYITGLKNQLNEVKQYFSNKRMDYLFKVIEISAKNTVSEYARFTKDFVEECIAEIQEAMTIPQEEQTKENKEN